MPRPPARAHASARTTIRCAVYTRKSTEEGLDQEFNSLDAQREACAAYVVSQRHEGWVLVPDYYDDGGYSGGNMDRPGLRQILADVKAGKVDVIVVYKVDRLTRALSDFAKIVDVLDACEASFVSITQSFNTTTSMGRLTLNVLLSFAQFEREVISERVRDKIAASKRKGMWMGGPVPLGYDVRERKLIVNESEAETVRHIMRRYLEVGSVRELHVALDREGVRSKLQIWSNGRQRGGSTFGRGALYHLLTNRLYRGFIVHHGDVYAGEHRPIVAQDLWDRVQAALLESGVERRLGRNASDPSLLAGMICDAHGRRMTPSHAAKGSVRYRYYVTVDEAGAGPRPIRIAADDLERPVVQGLKSFLADQPALVERLASSDLDGEEASSLLAAATSSHAGLSAMSPSALRQLAMDVDLRVVVNHDDASATIDPHRLANLLGVGEGHTVGPDRIDLQVDLSARRRSHEQRIAISTPAAEPVQRDGRLVALIIKAADARGQLLNGSISLDFSNKHTARLARLAYLAPDITAAILDGTQPRALTARQLLRASELPLDWQDQRRRFGFV